MGQESRSAVLSLSFSLPFSLSERSSPPRVARARRRKPTVASVRGSLACDGFLIKWNFILFFRFFWLAAAAVVWGRGDCALHRWGEGKLSGRFHAEVQPEVFGNGELMLEGDGMSVCVLRCVGGTFGRVYYSGIRLKERR